MGTLLLLLLAATPPAPDSALPPAPALGGEPAAIAAAVGEARGRAALIGERLFRARLVVWLKLDVDDDVVPSELLLLLDGDPVFAGEAPHRGAGYVKIYDGWVPPGRHTLATRLSLAGAREGAGRALLFEAAGGTTVVAARERATVVRFDAEAEAELPSAGDEASGRAEGDYEASVRGRFELVPLAEGDEAP